MKGFGAGARAAGLTTGLLAGLAAGLAFSAVPAAAFPAGASGALGVELKAAAPLVERTQYRRRVAQRPAPVRHRHARRGAGAALAAGAALGVLGAVAVASSARARPAPVYVQDPYYYPAYQPVPYCEWRRQDLFDRWGNLVGARNVKVCH